MDRPDEVRRVMNFKRLALTDLKVDIPRLAKKKVLSEALSTSGGCAVVAVASVVCTGCTCATGCGEAASASWNVAQSDEAGLPSIALVTA